MLINKNQSILSFILITAGLDNNIVSFYLILLYLGKETIQVADISQEDSF